MDQRVAVIGAGYAGMAAAVTLAQKGVKVTVFESGPVPGGRARRVKTEGREMDNGQHILIGAYTSLLGLMHTVGVPSEALLRLPLELRYADGFAFRNFWFPAPLGMLAGLLFNFALPLSDRIGAVRFMMFLRKTRFEMEKNLSVRDLLDRHRQNGRIGHYLWRPLCVSALNTPPEQASAQVFANVLRDSLAGDSEASDLLLPKVDLSRLFPEPACDFVAKNGGEVRLNSPVKDLNSIKDKYKNVIIAIGPHQLKALLPDWPQEFAYQPIYTCYLQYPGKVKLPFPMLGFAGGMLQWAFDRGKLTGEKGCIACVISAQGDHQQMQQEELAMRCHRELAESIPGLPDPEWTRVIAEKRATIACTPGAGVPGPELPFYKVLIAGDYTYADYPPTLEAAVRSGIRAANHILEKH